MELKDQHMGISSSAELPRIHYMELKDNKGSIGVLGETWATWNPLHGVERSKPPVLSSAVCILMNPLHGVERNSNKVLSPSMW